MSRLREEMKVIPRTAWAVAIVLYLGFVAFTQMVVIPRDADGADLFDPRRIWPYWGWALVAIVMPLFLSVYVLLVGYVNADARRRGMRHVMWTLLAIFIPNAIGFILYFIMREPLLRGCPGCGTMVSQGFAFCSKCGGALAHSCPQCRAAVQPEWSHCTKCGVGLQAQ